MAYKNPPENAIPHLKQMVKKIKAAANKFHVIIDEIDLLTEGNSGYRIDKETSDFLARLMKKSASDIDSAMKSMNKAIDCYKPQSNRRPMWWDVLVGDNVSNAISTMLVEAIPDDFIAAKVVLEKNKLTDAAEILNKMLDYQFWHMFEHFHSIQIDGKPLHLVDAKKPKHNRDLRSLWQ